MNFCSSLCVRHLWLILPRLEKLARNSQVQVEASALQIAQLYERCCSSACGALPVPAAWRDELEGRRMRGSARGHGTLQKHFFLSLPCFYALLILFQLFHFFYLINIHKPASFPPCTDFLNHFCRQWAYSLLLCQGQPAHITQPPPCINTQGFM